MLYPHVVQAVFGRPWAIMPETLQVIVDLARFRAEGGRLSEEEIAERLSSAQEAAGPRSGGRRTGAVAVLPLYGTIVPRAGMMVEMSGGTSIERFRAAFREALADESVGSILLDVDSPGGMVDGVPEIADEIRAARGRKPMAAVANTLMASAAYWLASATDEIIATPSSAVGSIGVFTAHDDLSAAYEQAGIRTTLISAGKYKTELADVQPLSDEARAALQQSVDDTYALFVGAVAKGRGDTSANVRNGYGQGRVLTAQRAVTAGLADRVGTFDEAAARLASGKVPTRSTRAEEEPTIRLEIADSATVALDALGEQLDGIDLPVAVPAEVGADSPEALMGVDVLLEVAKARARAHART